MWYDSIVSIYQTLEIFTGLIFRKRVILGHILDYWMDSGICKWMKPALLKSAELYLPKISEI